MLFLRPQTGHNMPKNSISPVVAPEPLERRIFLVRGKEVMLSPDPAEIYGVEPRAPIQAVKRNMERFPDDFMFQLNAGENANLKSQTVISSWGGPRRSTPYAFTELEVAMLSSVLRSEQAIRMNIQIMRAFVKLRETLSFHKDLARRLEQVEIKLQRHGAALGVLVDEIKKLKASPSAPRRRIGFTG